MSAFDMTNPAQFRTAVQNIRNVHAATPGPIQQRGVHWYDDVHEAVAKGVRNTSLNPAGGAGVVAAVSPNMDWEGNNIHALKELHSLKEKDFADIAKGERSSLQGKSIASAYGSGLAKAARIMRGEHPDNVLTAPKTNAFFHNIHEPQTAGPVTIDGRAFDIAHNRMQSWTADRKISGSMRTPAGTETAVNRRYQGVVGAYTAAAQAIHEETGHKILPHQVQAVTWEGGKVIERSAPTVSGRPRKVGVKRAGQPYL